MNANRRIKVKELMKQINCACTALEFALDLVQEIQEEEQESFDNLPEGIQTTEKGEQIQDNADELYNIMNEIESAIDNCNTWAETLDIM